jgi:hypothetical protein
MLGTSLSSSSVPNRSKIDGNLFLPINADNAVHLFVKEGSYCAATKV